MDNELKDIVDKLYNEYGSSGKHWEVTIASRLEKGEWTITIREIKKEAADENN